MDFFIIGYPRSGTSLLRLILDSHPDVAVPPECSFISFLQSKYPVRLGDVDRRNLVEDVWTAKKFTLWQLDRENLRSTIWDQQFSNFADVCSQIYRVWGGRKETSWRQK